MSRMRFAAAALALTMAAPSLHAQATNTFGGVLAANLAKYSGDDATDATNRFGAIIGLLVQRQNAGSNMFWESGVQFAMRGSGFEGTGFEGTSAVNYLEVPVMAGWMFPNPNRAMTPFVTGGIILALTMSCNSESTSGGSTFSFDCKDDVTSIDFPLAFGGGVNNLGPNGAWGVSILYNLGLATVDKPASGTAGDIKNGGFTIRLVWMMKKKKM